MAPLLFDLVLCALALPVLLATGYLGLLTLLSAHLRAPQGKPPRLRFDIVVPSHNEEGGIARTVKNLLALDYPAELRRVLVVADNCSDATADRAREAGAEVLVRHNLELRGKGYALHTAFEKSLSEGRADAVVVVDADTVVSANLLRAYAARLEAGAHAVQAHYGVLGGGEGWRPALMSVAFALFHGVRSNARERLGVTCGLRGNGMCFSHQAIRQVPHDAFSVVEDVEYGIRLARAGIRVHYAAEAEVLGEMVSSEKASRSQRKRWEGGRRLVAQQHGWPLLRDGLKSGSGLLLDLAMDVLVPPLARLAGACVAGLGAAVALSLWLGRPAWALWPFALSVGVLVLYVARGWQLSGSGLKGLAALARAPAYLVWKVWLAVAGKQARDKEWVRTERERPSDAPGSGAPGAGAP